MFEKQSSIKDLTLFKNKIKEILPQNLKAEFENNDITINNSKGKTVFKGKIGTNPIGSFIKGDFLAEKLVSKIALVVVILYVCFLLITFTSLALYDYQIFMMIVALAIIAVIKKFSQKRVSDLKKALEDLD
ncbi:MAG: hypothetical protein ACI4VF_00810 [Lachnospirales bacterium]